MTTVTTDNFTFTIDQLVWGETVAAGATVGTVTISNADGIGYIDIYGDDLASYAAAGKLNMVYNGETYTDGAMNLSGETSVTFDLVANSDISLDAVDILNMLFEAYTPDWEQYVMFDYDVTVNEAPEDVSLTTFTIAENATIGAVVGALAATDAENDALTYTLTDDANGLFSLVTENGVTSVVVNSELDYESATAHTIKVSVFDGYNTVEQSLSIDVEDIDENSAPTDIALSNNSISEAARAGFTVGVLSATDADGDDITWTLESGQGHNDNYFSLKTNDDGTVSVVLKNRIDHETSGGVYDLVVTATDSAGNATTQTLDVYAADDNFTLSSAPTGKTYVSVTEAAGKGQEIGYITANSNGDAFDVASARLVDNGDGMFKLKTRVVDGETRYYVVTAGKLDYEQKDSYNITVEATDIDGNVEQKSFDVEVLDATETADAARGKITIDASTLVAAQNGGVDWNAYLDDYYETVTYSYPNFLPSGTGYTSDTPATESVYTNGESFLSVLGSVYYVWSDPVTGEDVHTISGTITDLVFGEGALTSGVTGAEVTISGLELESGATPDTRISGEVNLVYSAFMHGPDDGLTQDLAYVKALLGSYAQKFLGSAGDDRYTGTIFNDTVKGNGGADLIKGGAGNDTIKAGAGDDVLKGQAGDDILVGGKGADKLYGGAGADTFVFTSASDSSGKAFDTIYDFTSSDIIDLSSIDAKDSKKGDQSFSFIGKDDFHGKEGELRFEKTKGETVIEGDTDGDGKADLILHLNDAMTMKAEYFDL